MGIIFVFALTGCIINHHNYEVGIVFILQMGKLRPRKVKKFVECGRSRQCSAVTNPSNIHEDAGPTPSLAQWVKDQA